jgi:antitoxin (DNA-binding transcriptional repressor) of toxin-antitoxin stability system
LQVQAGEQIGITPRGKLAAVIVPVKGEGEYDLCGIFENWEGARKRVKGVSVKDLVKEGRR